MPQMKEKHVGLVAAKSALVARRRKLITIAELCELTEVLEAFCASTYQCSVKDLTDQQIDEVEETVLAMATFVGGCSFKHRGTVH